MSRLLNMSSGRSLMEIAMRLKALPILCLELFAMDIPTVYYGCLRSRRSACPVTFFIMDKVYDVDGVKLTYEAYPKHYFDDLTSSSAYIPLIKWFLTDYDWKDENARLTWIDKCIEASTCFSYGPKIIEYLY